MQAGSKIELAAERLGEDVKTWVTRHRDDDRTWQWISQRLAERTGVRITPQWLGQLYTDRAEASSSPA